MERTNDLHMFTRIFSLILQWDLWLRIRNIQIRLLAFFTISLIWGTPFMLRLNLIQKNLGFGSYFILLSWILRLKSFSSIMKKICIYRQLFFSSKLWRKSMVKKIFRHNFRFKVTKKIRPVKSFYIADRASKNGLESIF